MHSPCAGCDASVDYGLVLTLLRLLCMCSRHRVVVGQDAVDTCTTAYIQETHISQHPSCSVWQAGGVTWLLLIVSCLSLDLHSSMVMPVAPCHHRSGTRSCTTTRRLMTCPSVRRTSRTWRATATSAHTGACCLTRVRWGGAGQVVCCVRSVRCEVWPAAYRSNTTGQRQSWHEAAGLTMARRMLGPLWSVACCG